MATLAEDVRFYATTMRHRYRTPWETGLLAVLDRVTEALAQIEQHDVNVDAFLQALEDPPAPNPALRALIKGRFND